jgi:CDP-diacylglycerol--glycerol-3-phosphate 3-phosphatidyltransferase
MPMLSPFSGDRPVLSILLNRWYAFCLVSLTFLLSGYFLLRAGWEPAYAARWLVITAAMIVYLLIVLRRSLPANHRSGETMLLPSFGWGNRMTLLRGMLVAALVGFLFSPRPAGPGLTGTGPGIAGIDWMAWIPGILYTLADLVDFLDGFLARLTNHATRMGEILDISLDGVGVLAAALLAVQYGQVPAWYLFVALARFFFLGGMWLRQRLGLPNHDLPPSFRRRGFAGLQMGFLAVMLWPLFSPPGTHLAAAVFALPFLAGFLRDWLVICGISRPGESLRGMWRAMATQWLPVGLRLAILAVSLGPIMKNIQRFQLLEGPMQALTVLELFAVSLVVLGAAGRSAAVLGLLILGFYQMQAHLTAVQMALVAAYAAILFVGSGALSLWKPEDYLISHQVGERQALRVERGG